MDTLDVQILQRLFRDPRAGYADLGAAVGLSPNAAKARVARMRSTGILRGFAAAPDAALLGLADGLLVFTHVEDLAAREHEVLSGLPDVPGVRFVDATLEGNVHVWVQHRDDADWERIERAAISLVGKPPALVLRQPPRGDASAALGANDWRLLRALVPDPRASLKDITKRSGLSFKTAKRRLAALVRDGRVRMEPILSPSDADGLVVYQLCVVLAPGAAVKDVLALLPDTAIVQTMPDARTLIVHAARATLREAQLDHRALQAAPLVCERVLFAIGTRRRADAWLDDAIAAKLAQLAAPNAAAPVVEAPVPVPRSK